MLLLLDFYQEKISLSLPPVPEVRSRIEQVREETLRNLLKAAYLFCARIGEVVHYTYPCDRKTGTTGSKLTAKEAVYAPSIEDPGTVGTLMMIALAEGRELNLNQIARMKEPAAVFHVWTEKRKGLKHIGIRRDIALPLNPSYEPWAKELLEYFQKRQVLKEPIFPFNRQKAYALAKPAFEGLSVKITHYRKTLPELDEKGKHKMQMIPEHTRNFTVHSLRKIRENELRRFYRFDAFELSAYGGWTMQTTAGTSAALAHYDTPAWEDYFPKLLRKR